VLYILEFKGVSSMNWQRSIFILTCQGLAGIAQADATHMGIEAALAHESNIGRAEYSRDVQKDTAFQVGANISRSVRLTANSGLVARAGIQLQEQAHYDNLSLAAAGAGIRYRLQPFPGFTTPWIDLSLGAERLKYRDSEIRDGWVSSLGVAAGKYFTDKLRMIAGWMAERRHAENSRVFDLRNHGWHLGIDFHLTPQASLYAKATRIFGDQVSSASQSSVFGNPLRYSAQTPDAALSEHGNSRNAYRFDAVTNTMELGYNHAIRGNMAFDISARYFDADAEGGHTYHGYSARAGLLYQF
jgi:hypothetical protein